MTRTLALNSVQQREFCSKTNHATGASHIGFAILGLHKFSYSERCCTSIATDDDDDDDDDEKEEEEEEEEEEEVK
jgi:hypothetical protein